MESQRPSRDRNPSRTGRPGLSTVHNPEFGVTEHVGFSAPVLLTLFNLSKCSTAGLSRSLGLSQSSKINNFDEINYSITQLNQMREDALTHSTAHLRCYGAYMTRYLERLLQLVERVTRAPAPVNLRPVRLNPDGTIVQGEEHIHNRPLPFHPEDLNLAINHEELKNMYIHAYVAKVRAPRPRASNPAM